MKQIKDLTSLVSAGGIVFLLWKGSQYADLFFNKDKSVSVEGSTDIYDPSNPIYINKDAPPPEYNIFIEPYKEDDQAFYYGSDDAGIKDYKNSPLPANFNPALLNPSRMSENPNIARLRITNPIVKLLGVNKSSSPAPSLTSALNVVNSKSIGINKSSGRSTSRSSKKSVATYKKPVVTITKSSNKNVGTTIRSSAVSQVVSSNKIVKLLS